MSSTTTTTTVVNQNANGKDNSKMEASSNSLMTDSGVSTTSLRLTLQHHPHTTTAESLPKPGSIATSATSMTSEATKDSTAAARMQDSGICSDMMRLSLTNDGGATASRNIEEFFEPDEDGDNQVHLAVASGMVDVVEALTRIAPSPQHLSMQNAQGYTPLHIAVLQNQPAILRRLVVAGARLDARDNEGNTPLHLTARRGYVECAESILRPVSVQERPANTNAQALPAPVDIINQRNSQGEHLVHLASMGGHLQYLQFLSWNNTDMNALEGRAGRSALHLAVGARNLPLIQILVEPRPRGCGVNPDLVDWYGRTAHHLSLLNVQPDIAAYLGPRTPSSANLSLSWLQESSSEAESEDGLAQQSALLLNSSA